MSSPSTRYRGSPERTRRLTSASISPLETEMSKAGWLHAGSLRTQEGLSHSCERPTSISPASKAQTISVALASSETTRTLRGLASWFQTGAEKRESAEQCERVAGVAQELVAVKRNGRDEALGQTRGSVRIQVTSGPNHEVRDREKG